MTQNTITYEKTIENGQVKVNRTIDDSSLVSCTDLKRKEQLRKKIESTLDDFFKDFDIELRSTTGTPELHLQGHIDSDSSSAMAEVVPAKGTSFSRFSANNYMLIRGYVEDNGVGKIMAESMQGSQKYQVYLRSR